MRLFYFLPFYCVVTLLCQAVQANVSEEVRAPELMGKVWRVTFETRYYGPLEARVRFEKRSDGVHALTDSQAAPMLRKLPGMADLKGGLPGQVFDLVFSQRVGVELTGKMAAPWSGRDVALTVAGDKIAGEIRTGGFRGKFSGVVETETGPIRDYPTIEREMERVIETRVFDRGALATEKYENFAGGMRAVAAAAQDDLDFALGFFLARPDLPFSHTDLQRSSNTAEVMMASFEQLRVGNEAVDLTFADDIATLRVTTMMGLDTIENITKAFAEIHAKQPKYLIVDLRGNGGGAFAIAPLIQNLIREPLDAGYFIARKWTDAHTALPTKDEVMAASPWAGMSIIGFWRDVQSVDLLRLKFQPAQPGYRGPVFVLIDKKSASATEIAVAALKAAKRVTLVGEKTAGEVLSQSPTDVGGGYVLNLPIANYVTLAFGRLEGVGVSPDVACPSAEAADRAVALAKQAK
nr:S41 family peptidase [uncultured Undibacterium sp.]